MSIELQPWDGANGSPFACTPEIFDELVDRWDSDSAKWSSYGKDVLPLWVADMDFVSPAPIIAALQRRIAHGVFGYAKDPVELREAICHRLATLYNWQVAPEHLVFLPGLVCGLNVVARAIGEPGDGVLVNTPVYPPFLTGPVNQGRVVNAAQLAVTTRRDPQGRPYLYYEPDLDALEAAITDTTRLFMLCNPHNPVGRAYTVAELERLGELALRHHLVICSDEIHCDLLLAGTRHHPIATLAPEIAARTITLMAPSKTFNIPGLGCSFAVVPNAELRRQLTQAAAGIVPHVNVLGLTAALAAYTECEPWLVALRSYLTDNRTLIFDFVQSHLPEVRMTLPEATYLAWLDFRPLKLEDPFDFLLREAKVALNNGAAFGAGGEGFLRLNFGCCRSTLQQALEQMAEALARVRV
ncbi:MAG TPA: PatB family C-S lyase [Caldilineaceae bacterium]|nr:PatB family C-S lyase [Caldilineaceae bacterium]